MEGYTPFKMKAKDYGNSPMLMNFPDSFPGGVGSSPAKGFFSRIAKKVKNLGKKVLGMTPIGKALGIGKDKKDPSMAAADATAAATRPHTHDETGAVVPEAEGPQPAVAETYALKIVRQPISSDFEISSSTLPGSNMSLSKASLEIFDFTTTVNQPTWDGTQSATTSITVADPSGIRGDEESCTVSGIGFDNSTEQFVQTVNNATKVMTVNTAQQLIHGTILTFKGCANTAVIKAKIRIDKIPDSNLAVVLDLDNILTASTS